MANERAALSRSRGFPLLPLLSAPGSPAVCCAQLLIQPARCDNDHINYHVLIPINIRVRVESRKNAGRRARENTIGGVRNVPRGLVITPIKESTDTVNRRLKQKKVPPKKW